MRFLANILTTTKFPEKDYYNIVKTKEELINNIPTLIVGWNTVNQLFDNVSILDWKIDDNTYWTFGRRERGEKYEENIKKFENLVINRLKRSVEYIYFNVLTENDNKKKELLSVLLNNINKNVYIDNNILFFCCENSEKVYGLSLTDIEYEGLDRTKFLSKVLRCESVKLIKNEDTLNSNIRYELYNLPYMIPYLFT